jgi:uncharacterized membrane protein YgcG
VKRLVALFFGLVLSFGVHAQQARVYTPADLDAMLAPIALYPDPLLTNILTASLTPLDVKAAADWSAANPNVTGDAALRAVDGELWHPSVKALVAYPDVLARMGENMQWVTDLGQAYQNQYPQLAASIQGLRARAQDTGALHSDEQQQVYQQNDAIYVQPTYPNVVYAPYYDPLVVYGAWWWPAIYPVVWRPWVPHAVYVTRIVAPVRIAYPGHVWHPGYVHPAGRAVGQAVGQIRPMAAPQMPTPRAVSPRPQQQWHGQPSPARQQQWQQSRQQWQASRPPSVSPYHPTPESQRAPIVHSGPVMRTPPVMHSAPMVRGAGASRSSVGGGHWSGGGRGGGSHGGGRGRG